MHSHLYWHVLRAMKCPPFLPLIVQEGLHTAEYTPQREHQFITCVGYSETDLIRKGVPQSNVVYASHDFPTYSH